MLLGVVLWAVPGQMLELAVKLVTSPDLAAGLAGFQPGLVAQLGAATILAAAVLALPATLGYLGAARENRVLLTLVRTIAFLVNVSCLIFLGMAT